MIFVECCTYQRKSEGKTIKKLYLIRHAKSSWEHGDLKDYERGLSKRGLKDLEMIGSYLSLKKIRPDLILSSAALRAQLTADILGEKIGYEGEYRYLEELYLTRPEMVLNVLSLQEPEVESLFLVGHNPALSELANILQPENFTKFPTLGVLALDLAIESWEEILEGCHGRIDYFIFPKQFRYYLPGQIRATLSRGEG